MRFFNTAGTVVPQDHYCVPPLERLDLEEILLLIDREQYFVLHAPRQSGKTTLLLALVDELNAGGRYRAAYVDVEVRQFGFARDDIGAGMRAILSEMAHWAERHLEDAFPSGIWRAVLEESGPLVALRDVLGRWAAADPRPLVLMMDEIDALYDDTLLSVLRQLRTGFVDRPRWFPQSVILCGTRDVRDHRIRSSAEQAPMSGGSGFNIVAESLRLGDFSPPQVRALLEQHTEDTGQAWTAGAKDAVWDLTRGQPWLVNALAYQACFEEKAGRDRSRPVTEPAVRDACERLILRRDTYLSHLMDKLEDDRVRRVVEPSLTGAMVSEPTRPGDLEYVCGLGLVRPDGPPEIANPIYREAIPRVLAYTAQTALRHDPAWYVEEGELRVDKLLEAFQTFFREHSEHWLKRFQYQEAGPQLLLQAFLQRTVGGGRIEREYAWGGMRTDLLVLWPTPGGGPGDAERTVIECRCLYKSLERTIEQGLAQTREYMSRCAAEAGHLVIFDRAPDKPWEDKVFRRNVPGANPETTAAPRSEGAAEPPGMRERDRWRGRPEIALTRNLPPVARDWPPRMDVTIWGM